MTVNLKFVQTPTNSLYTSLSITASSLTLGNLLEDLDSNILTQSSFGSLGYCTIDPGILGSEEIVSFTGVVNNGDGTMTLTGLARDLQSQYPYTASGTGNAHGSGALVVFGDNPQLYGRLAGKDNDETITGTWSAPTPTISAQVATKGYVDATAFAGAPNATTSVQGLVQLPTQAQIDAKTATGSTGATLTVTPNTQRSTLLSDYVADTGTSTAYVITPSPAISAYTSGQIFTFKATNANTTTTPTLNINALGAKTLVKLGSLALSVGDIVASQIILVEYDGTNFQMLNPGSVINESGIFGDGSDGVVTETSRTLSRDQFYSQLTIPNGVVLNSGNFRIFVQGTLTLSGTGTIVNNGNAGGTGGNGTKATPGIGGTGGTAGAAIAAGSLAAGIAGSTGGAGGGGDTGSGNSSCGGGGGAGSGSSGGIVAIYAYNIVIGASAGIYSVGGAGGIGGNGASSATGTSISPGSAGSNGSAGQNSSPSIGVSGTAYVSTNGNGGTGGGPTAAAGGTGGSVGTATTKSLPHTFVQAQTLLDLSTGTPLKTSASATGGGGGGGSGTSGGASGGGGGGGGGGYGGSGGAIVLVYHTLTNSGTISVAGGAAGTGGSVGAGTGGSNGVTGLSGATGIIYQIVV